MVRRAVLLAMITLVACNKNEYAAAAITVAAAVAVAAINRAATDECWASCQPGFACDRSTGICVPIDELEADPSDPEEDGGCIEEDDGTVVCPDDPETWVDSPVEEPLMTEPEPVESEVAPER